MTKEDVETSYATAFLHDDSKIFDSKEFTVQNNRKKVN